MTDGPDDDRGAGDAPRGYWDPEVRRRAADLTHRADELTDARPPRRPLAPFGVVLLGLLVVWMIVSINRIYPSEVVAPARVDGVVATLLALLAIRLAAAHGPAPVSAGLVLLLGAGIVLLGLWASETETVRNVRIVDGLVAVSAALLCLLSPRRGPAA